MQPSLFLPTHRPGCTASSKAVHWLLLQASSSATPSDPGLDLSRADVAVFVFDAADPTSFEAAQKLLVGISDAAGNTLPCVLVAAKDDLGLSSVSALLLLCCMHVMSAFVQLTLYVT